MPKLNPFRAAKKYLITDPSKDVPSYMMYTVRGALEQVWYHSNNRKVVRKALDHFNAAVYPYYSERTWVTKTVLNNHRPHDQDMQNYRHRWLDYLAQQWDKGEIK